MYTQGGGILVMGAGTTAVSLSSSATSAWSIALYGFVFVLAACMVITAYHSKSARRRNDKRLGIVRPPRNRHLAFIGKWRPTSHPGSVG
jgi:hypothetical protein